MSVTPTSPAFPLGLGGPSGPGTAPAFHLANGHPSTVMHSPRGSRPGTPLISGSAVSAPNGNGATYYEEIKRWADADVAAWLHSNRLGVHAACFARNDINGSVLLDVDQAALKEMGISSVGDRIRIFAAVKALKKRCTESAAARRASMRLGAASEAAAAVAAAHANAAHADGEMEYLEHDQPPANAARGFVPPGFAHVNGTPLSPSTGRRAAHTRPPPLHLTQSAAYGMPTTPTQSSPAPTASIPAPTGRSGLVPATARSVHPISPAPARSPLPPTKTSQPAQSGRAFPPSWDDSPTGQHRKVNSIGTATVYGSGTAQPAQQQTPTGQRPINPPVTGIRPLYQNPTRPSTATSAGTYGSNYGYGSACDHAQSGSASSSPTSAAFSVNAGRPSTAGGIGSGGGLGGIGGLVHPPLTPITESASYVRTPTTPGAAGLGSANVLNSASSAGGYSVGRGAFGGRPITPGSGFSAGSSSIASPAIAGSSVLSSSVTRGRPDTADGHGLAPPSLEDLKRRTIKFIGEDGNSRIVNVSDCRDAYDVLARVLKKFGKPASGNSYTPTAGQRDEGETENGESWGIFATSSDGQTKALSDNELLAICHAPQPHDPLRERGLTLRALRAPEHGEDSRRPAGRRKLEAFFGERMTGQNGPGSPSAGGAFSPKADGEEGGGGQVTTTGKKMNRASTVSIMSGLGVGHFSNAPKLPTQRGSNGSAVGVGGGHPGDGMGIVAPQRSPSASVLPRKARNFFGQRPPSELISSHLADYFPATEKRVLERTARKSIYGRPSTSIRSKRDSTWSFAGSEAPPLPGKESLDVRRYNAANNVGGEDNSSWEETPVIHIGFDDTKNEQSSASSSSLLAGPPTLPPVVGRSSLEDWSKSLQTVGSPVLDTPPSKPMPALPRPTSTRRASGESVRSRRSVLGRSSTNRDRSETASLLTVDEITQEVENRRESMTLAGAGGGWVVDEDGVPIPVPAASRSGGASMRPPSASAASTRPSSGLSSRADGSPGLDNEHGEDGAFGRTSLGAPGEETDRHMGDPMAVLRRTTSRASSVSELRNAAPGSPESEEEEEEEEEEDEFEEESEGEDGESEGEGDGTGGVYQSRTNGVKEPIRWIKGALIGAGSFGNVFLGMNAKNGLLMAVKQVELPSGDSHMDQRKKSMLEALEREIELLKTLQHDNIVQYLDSYADGTHLNIFLEYVPGGSVVALLRNYGAFEEPLVRNFVRQILQGLSFLHAKEIVHRDIKGANILVDNKGGIKISDFGISKKVENDLLTSARAHRPSLQGSVFWMAPEVVKQTSYTRKADIWSLGCLVVEMISGTHPWADLNQMQALFRIGSSAKPDLPDDISQDAIDFLTATFELNHNKRPSADELLQHAFITEEYTGPANSTGAGTTDSNSSGAGTSASSLSAAAGSTGTSTGASSTSTTGTAGTGTGTKKKGLNAGNKKAQRDNKDTNTSTSTNTNTNSVAASAPLAASTEEEGSSELVGSS